MNCLWRRMFGGLVFFAAAFGADAAGNDELRFWLENMIRHHDYTVEEAAGVLKMPAADVERALKELGIARTDERRRKPGEPLLVLPYPGGRHPRIGFLDGAIDPMRGTKFSLFPPWRDAGYIVIDLPEAVWADGELIFLAHTHIPTVWDKKGVKLKNIDWTRKKNGRLEERRVLPDGVTIESRVIPRREFVDMELRLTNGSDRPLSKMRSQVCIMLKGAPDFNAQTRDNKVLVDEVAAVKSKDGRRWIATAWDNGRAWENPPVPCIHSDPRFPDCAPGKSVVARGRIFFFDGNNLRGEIERLKSEGKLHWPPEPSKGENRRD